MQSQSTSAHAPPATTSDQTPPLGGGSSPSARPVVSGVEYARRLAGRLVPASEPRVAPINSGPVIRDEQGKPLVDWAELSPESVRDAQIELAIARKRRRMPRGAAAATRISVVNRHGAAALRAMGEDKWAQRLSQCGQLWQTAYCESGCGGTVIPQPQRRAYRCGLQCCALCARIKSRRLATAVYKVAQKIQPRRGWDWRFLTVSLKPRGTHAASWDAVIGVRKKLNKWLKGIGVEATVSAIEFGSKGHPHLHMLLHAPWLVRDTLCRLLVEWTGGTVRDLAEPVAQGDRRTKRGKAYTRTWEAVPPADGSIGGDWYVDVRALRGDLRAGIREVTKYLANPFGEGGAQETREDQIGAARLAVAVAVAGKGRNRIMGTGVFKGVVGLAMGTRKDAEEELDADVATVAGVDQSKGPVCRQCGGCLRIVEGIQKHLLRHGNRVWAAELGLRYAQSPAPPG